MTSYASANEGDANVNAYEQALATMNRAKQRALDRSVPKTLERWIAYAACALAYGARAYTVRGYYIVTYGLGIYNLNLLIGFLTPGKDVESLGRAREDGPTLPTTASEREFKPFVRKLPEFKFWWMSMKSIGVAFVMTFVPIFDVPVFWPILLMYFLMLFFMTMKQQVRHMIKHRYVPFTTGKKKYAGAGARGGGANPGGSAGLKNND